jgi:hypothetical protein
MSRVDEKRKVMGNIGALNVLSEGLPKLKNRTNSFSSINNSNNSINFLVDVVTSLVGYQDLTNNITDLLSRKLPEIEIEIKNSLKSQLKEFVSCGSNPSIPIWFKSTSDGVNFKIKDIDFLGLLKTSPTSIPGILLYSDNNSGLNSKDFNTFLYTNISQNKGDFTTNGGQYSSWGSNTSATDILDVKFSPISSSSNNVINIKCNSNYDNKSLIEFNNDLIDSIDLFTTNGKNNNKLFNSIIDNLFGTISVNGKKNKNQIKSEVELNEILNRIINSDDDEIIDDSFFTFTNDDLVRLDAIATNKSKGVGIIETCGNTEVSIPIDLLETINTELLNSSTQTTLLSNEELEYQIISDAIDTIGNQQTIGSAVVDIPTIKFNFILNIINNFTIGIFNTILTPKLVLIYSLNNKIIYGQDNQYSSAIDFVKKNRYIVKAISSTIKEILIRMLLSLAIKTITLKLSNKLAADNIEKINAQRRIILSLLGIPSNTLTQIRNLGSFSI